METIINHQLSYSTNKQIPVAIVAKTLLANERLLNESIRLLPIIYPDLQIEKITIGVREVRNASPLKEWLSVGIFLAYQDELEKEVPAIITYLTGREVPESMETLVTVLVLLVAVYVIDATVERFMPGKSIKKLKAEYERKLHEVSGTLNIDESELAKIIETRFSENKVKSIFKKAYELFLPAKMDTNVHIESPKGIEIHHDVIEEIPSEIDFLIEESRITYDLPNASIT